MNAIARAAEAIEKRLAPHLPCGVAAFLWSIRRHIPADVDEVLSQINGLPKESSLRGFAPGLVKRWEVENALIPVYANHDPRALEAMELIEKTVGRDFFRLCGSQSEVKDAKRGVIFTKGQAAGDPSKPDMVASGNVSGDPVKGPGWPHDIVDANGIISGVLWVNLDSPTGKLATFEVVVHELGHALGLGDHFHDFSGVERAAGFGFWPVLARLYALRPGSPYVSRRGKE